MPDWFTHTLVGWITGKTTKQDVALIVIGSLIPDLEKISLVFNWFGMSVNPFFTPIHTPIGALLFAGILSMLFGDIKKTFLVLGIGIATHFILDFLLIEVHGGVQFLFPFSWDGWQYFLIDPFDHRVTLIALLAAVVVYSIYGFYEKRTRSATQ
jgi:hypothetical protein